MRSKLLQCPVVQTNIGLYFRLAINILSYHSRKFRYDGSVVRTIVGESDAIAGNLPHHVREVGYGTEPLKLHGRMIVVSGAAGSGSLSRWDANYGIGEHYEQRCRNHAGSGGSSGRGTV